MTPIGKKNRVIFIDLIRAFAVIMMVQGHTIDVLLANDYRNFDSVFYSVWWFNRGMTAPIFLFTAGMVFNYLFRLNKEPFYRNPRTWKGVKRFLLLLAVGYLIKYPSKKIIDFSHVTPEQWRFFWSVDVLQLIAFGVLTVMILNILAELTKLRDLYVFLAAAIIEIALYPLCETINWGGFLHPAIAGYLYKGTGSNFPLFPWLCYVHMGAIMGSYLAKNPTIFKTSEFTRKIAIAGLVIVVISQIGNGIEYLVTGTSHFWTTSPNLIIFRIAYVLLLNAAFTALARNRETIPRIIIFLGRNTLLIYVVHLVILYGSPWTLGINHFWGMKHTPLESIGYALEMIGLMCIMVIIQNKLNMKSKPLVAS